MILVIFSLVWSLLGAHVLAAEVLRPRGVSLAKASFYDPTKSFHCFDGSASIPFAYVNDDYCDCRDGSDEPGTSACPNSFFYCANVGHKPLNVRSSRVNDGVCDCCDASDEYLSNTGCINTCNEMGRAAREEAIKQEEERKQGYELRRSMIQEGLGKKKETESKIEEMSREKEEAEKIRLTKEETKQAVEEPEKEALKKYQALADEKKVVEEEQRKSREEAEARAAFINLDIDGDGVIILSELQSKPVFDTNRDGEVSEDEVRFYLHSEDSMNLDQFISLGWALIKPAYTMAGSIFTPPTTTESPNEENGNISPFSATTEEGRSASEMYAEDQSDDLESQDPEEEELEEGDYDGPEDNEKEESVDKEEEEDEQEEEVQYDEETQKLVDAANAAREEFDEADRKVRDLIRELRSLQEAQEKDYGKEQEFRHMDGSCYDFTDREYTYTLCPFDKATQKPKSGHGDTRLGQWGEWTGPPDNKYKAMKYSNGQACWNGPARSAEVHLSCGVENKLTAVSEPNRCEYHFLMTSPAVCTNPEETSAVENTLEHSHTEL